MNRSTMSLVLASAFVFATSAELRAQNNQDNEKTPLVAVMPREIELPQAATPGDKKRPQKPCVPDTVRHQQKLKERFNKQKLPQKHAQRGFLQRKHGMDNRRFG